MMRLMVIAICLFVPVAAAAEPMLMIPEAQARAMLQGVHTLKQEKAILIESKAQRDALIFKYGELVAAQEQTLAKQEELDRLKDAHLALLEEQKREAERMGWWKAAGASALTAAGFVVFSLVK